MKNFKVELSNNIIFRTTLAVRIYDINYGNHLGNDSVISLLHEARAQFFRSHGYTELDIEGIGILITSLATNFVKESFYADKLQVSIGLCDVTKFSMLLTYQVTRNDGAEAEIARACTSIVFYDYKSRKISKIPKQFLQKLSLDDEKTIGPALVLAE